MRDEIPSSLDFQRRTPVRLSESFQDTEEGETFTMAEVVVTIHRICTVRVYDAGQNVWAEMDP